MDRVSYALGLGIGQQLPDIGAQSLNIDDFSQAIKGVIAGTKPKIDSQGAQTLIQNFSQEQKKKQRTAAGEKGKVVREAGKAYLIENAKKEGVVTLPNGLQCVMLKEDNGKKPKATDQVTYHYKGVLHDDTLFDSSVQRGEPATFALNRVIAGWTEGLQLVQGGAKYRFFIPYHLGYGEREVGNTIPPSSALVFDVELIKVI